MRPAGVDWGQISSVLSTNREWMTRATRGGIAISIRVFSKVPARWKIDIWNLHSEGFSLCDNFCSTKVNHFFLLRFSSQSSKLFEFRKFAGSCFLLFLFFIYRKTGQWVLPSIPRIGSVTAQARRGINFKVRKTRTPSSIAWMPYNSWQGRNVSEEPCEKPWANVLETR